MAKAKTAQTAPDKNQFPLYQAQRVQLPSQVIPEKRHIKIYEAGPEGAIVGFALAGLINYLSSLRDGSPFQASAPMLYRMARRYDGFSGPDTGGTTLEAALYGWQKHGVTTEKIWPYIPGKGTQEKALTEQEEQAAGTFKPQSIERVPKNVQSMKAAIVERGAVFVGATVNKGWYEPSNGVIPFSPKSESFGGKDLLSRMPGGKNGAILFWMDRVIPAWRSGPIRISRQTCWTPTLCVSGPPRLTQSVQLLMFGPIIWPTWLQRGMII
jgi:hypothetical protein